jgi:rare lipoprotein A (peptidoglycan hydrolase)
LKLQLIVLICLFLLGPQIVFADEPISDNNFINFSASIDGKNFKFVQPAVVENEELFVPMRSFFSIFNAGLTWDEQEKTTVIKTNEKEYLLDMDLANLTIQGNENLVYEIKIINSQTYIPLSFLKDILNYQLSWDNENGILQAQKRPDATGVFANLPEAPKYSVVETFFGTASWYGNEFHGRKTNNGEIFDQNALTCAHRTLPFNTYLRVTFLETNESVIVRVNDRGPHVKGRILDLSKGAAEEIGLRPHGLGEVKVEVLALIN